MAFRSFGFALAGSFCLLSLSACAPTAPTSATRPASSLTPPTVPGVSVAQLEARVEMVDYVAPDRVAGVETLCPAVSLKEVGGQSGAQLDWLQVVSPDDPNANFGTSYISPRRIPAGASRAVDLLGECVSSGRRLNEIQVTVTFRDDEGRAGWVAVAWARGTSAEPAAEVPAGGRE